MLVWCDVYFSTSGKYHGGRITLCLMHRRIPEASVFVAFLFADFAVQPDSLWPTCTTRVGVEMTFRQGALRVCPLGGAPWVRSKPCFCDYARGQVLRAPGPRVTSSDEWEVLLGIRLLGTTFWCALSNHQAATAQMGTWQAEFSLRIKTYRRVPTPLSSTSPFSGYNQLPRALPSPPGRGTARTITLYHNIWYIMLYIYIYGLPIMYYVS